MWDASFMCVIYGTWLIWDMTHMGHDSLVNHTLCDKSHWYVIYMWFTCEMWFTCDLHVRCDLHVIYICHMSLTRINTWCLINVWFTCVTCISHEYDSLISVTWLIHICDRHVTHVTHTYGFMQSHVTYGVASISRLLKMTRLFCRILSLLQGSFAKETYNFKEPTNRSHPIVI